MVLNHHRPRFGAIALAAVMIGTSVHAQSFTSDPGLVPAVKLADCTPKAAISYAEFEAIKRKGALADPILKLLTEFEALNNKSTSKGDEPMWKGLSAPDAIRAAEVSAKVAQMYGLTYSDSAYVRDLRVINMMLADAVTEYSTTEAPVFDDTKADEKMAYTVLLAMREGLDGGKDDPVPTANQTVCSVDLAFYKAAAAPMAKYNSFGAQSPPMQAITDRLKAKYGDKMDPVNMSPADADDYSTVRNFVASANRTRAYIGDLENLRMIVAASAIRRETHITDQMAGGTDVDFGATLKKRADNGEFNASMTKALFVQDKIAELFPTDEIKALKAQQAADEKK